MTYTLEVLRDGSVVDTRELNGQNHHTMGRTPDNGAETAARDLAPGRCTRMPSQAQAGTPEAVDVTYAGGADIVLEHPSSSRLHAVIQFKAGTGEAFLYDAASAHGTFLNKRRLKPRQHEPLRLHTLLIHYIYAKRGSSC